MASLSPGGMAAPRWSPGLLALVLALHGAGVWLLLNRQASAEPPVEPPILVSLVMPEPAPPAEPQPEVKPQPKPRPTPQAKPQPRREVQREQPRPEPAPQLAAATPEPAPAVAAPVPEPVAQPEPAPEPVQRAAPPPVAKAAPEPEPVVEAPRFDADYLDNPHPAYPRLSRRMGEEGRVQLRVQVDTGGAPAQVLLHKSSGHARLDEAALDTVKRWRFVPARQGGKPVAAWVIVPIQFSLNG